MRSNRNSVAELAAKVGDGDSNAHAALRDQMASQMAFIVRRALQTGRAVSSLERRILAEARRLDALDLEQRIDAIAHLMCATVLSNLRAVPREPRSARETVVDYATTSA